MAEALRMTSKLEQRGPAGAFVLSDEDVATVGAGKRTFPVLLTVAGATFPLRLSRMGGENLIGLRREVREAAGLSIGDVVEIEVTRDSAERTVDVPSDLAEALSADPEADAAFSALAYSHRKEYVRWIDEAKRERTRVDRIARTVTMVRDGQTR